MKDPFSRPPELWVDIASEWEEIDRGLALLLTPTEPVLTVDPAGRTAWMEEGAASLDPYVRYFRLRPPIAVLPPRIAPNERKEDARGLEQEDVWVEFRFEYPDRSPVVGLEYLLIDPQRGESRGTLGANGTVTKRGALPGGWTIVLKEVEAAFFRHARRACDDGLEVTARTSGYPDGTPAKVRLYRELRESSTDVLAEVDTEVRGDRVEATLRYDYASDEVRAAETGVIRLIAEVSVENGASWAKTDPLELSLKTLQNVAWSSERVEPGQPIELVVETAGYPNGAEVSLEIWRLDWSGDRKVADVGPLSIRGGRAVARGTYRAPNAADFTIEECGEYYAIAKTEDNVTRTRRSGLVWCAWVDAEDVERSEAA